MLKSDYLLRDIPPKELSRFGRDVKTASPFRANLKEIVEIARQRHEPLVLMSFAFYQPDDYSFEKFTSGALDYEAPGDIFAGPTELWGHPANVVRGIREHNRVLREVAEEHRGELVFVDQEALIPRQGHYFVDICHFSPLGEGLFARNLMAHLPADRARSGPGPVPPR